MEWVTGIDELLAHYGQPRPNSLRKVADHITPPVARFIGAAKFCLLSSVGPEGTDGSPRGDREPVVRVHDAQTLLLPDWKGNDRLDTLRNILRDGRVSLYFMIPGLTYSLRVNGTARITLDADLRAGFEREGQHPRSVVVIRVAEAYPQCARALQRSELWGETPVPQGLPTLGDMLEAATGGEIDATAYEADSRSRAHLGWW